MFEIFLGEHNLISHQTTRIYTSLNRNGVKLDHRCLYRAADVVTQDGQRARKVTLDARDKDQIPKIIQRERKRHGIPPLSMEALTIEASKFTETTVEPLVVQINIDVNFAFLGHAMMKIAYELAFLWLGESYLDDPLAVELREAILENDIASTDDFAGYINWAETCTAFNLWTPHKAHHLAFASVAADSVVIAARVFDIYAIAIPVSRDASRYIKTGADATKLPFVAIDAVTGRTIQTTFGEEQRRLVREMQRHRKPPLPDPLSAEEMAVS